MNRTTRNLLLLTALALLAFARFAQPGEGGVVPAGLELAGTEWWLEDIDGRGVIDMSHTTVHFFGDGKVAGDTGCNRYTGTVGFTGSGLTFGPLTGGRRVCPPALMGQEWNFKLAMAKVASWEVPDTGLLHLKDFDGNTVLRAWPVLESGPASE